MTRLIPECDATAMTGWSEPISIDGGECPKFPIEILPEPGRIMVQHVAELIQCDPALPSACLLGIYAMGSQGRVTVRAQSQKEQTALWLVPIAGVSERKSSAFSPMLKPVYDYEQAESERMSGEIRESHAKRKLLAARIAKLEKNPKEGTCCDDMTQLIRELDETPLLHNPRLIIDNVTEEVIAQKMIENGECISLVSTEPTLFQQMQGTRDRKSVLDVFLKAWSADPMRIDRISRQSIIMNHPQMTILVAAQPGAVREFIQDKRFMERGILSRFLLFPCKDHAGLREWKKSEWNTEIVHQYSRHIERILSDRRKVDLGSKVDLGLTPPALEQYISHYNDMEKKQALGGDFYQNAWAGKECGRTLRIAAVLHRAEGNDNPMISPDEMTRAIEISRYNSDSVLYIQCLVAEPDDVRKLRVIRDRMISQGKIIYSIREIYRGLQRHFPNTAVMRNYMNTLVEYGHVRLLKERPETYMLHPMYRNQTKTVTDWDT